MSKKPIIDEDGYINLEKVIALAVPIIIIVIALVGSIKIVPTGYTGVRTTFGQVSDEVVNQGFNFKIPFVQSIKLVNNKQQDITFDSEVWGETTEKTPVYASNIIVTYQIVSESSSWIYANVTNVKDLITDSIVASAIKSAMVELSVTDVTNRSKIEPLAREKLNESLEEKYGENKVVVLKIVLNQMDFEESYNEAIAAKSIAQQTYEKQLIENKTNIEKAEADAKVTKTKAQATADAKIISAKAENEANKLLEKSLTDNIIKNNAIDKWNGELPQVMSDSDVLLDILNKSED